MTIILPNAGWKPDKDTAQLPVMESKEIFYPWKGVKNEARIALIRASSHMAVNQRKVVLRCVMLKCGGNRGLL